MPDFEVSGLCRVNPFISNRLGVSSSEAMESRPLGACLGVKGVGKLVVLAQVVSVRIGESDIEGDCTADVSLLEIIR